MNMISPTPASDIHLIYLVVNVLQEDTQSVSPSGFWTCLWPINLEIKFWDSCILTYNHLCSAYKSFTQSLPTLLFPHCIRRTYKPKKLNFYVAFIMWRYKTTQYFHELITIHPFSKMSKGFLNSKNFSKHFAIHYELFYVDTSPLT